MKLNSLFVPLFLGLLALAPAAAFAGDKDTDWGSAGGWEFYKAPATTHFNLQTIFIGTKNQVTSGDIDSWQGVVYGTAEVAIPGIPLSVFGEIGYQFNKSGDGSSAQGWTDLTVGAKVELVKASPLLLSIWAAGVFDIGTKSVTFDNFKNQARVGASFTLMPVEIIALNGGVDFGLLTDLIDQANNKKDAFQFAFFGELAIIPPGKILTARVGLTGVLRDSGFDKSQFQAYVEAKVLFVFLRVAAPFDIQNVSGIKTTFDTGQLVITAGLSFGF